MNKNRALLAITTTFVVFLGITAEGFCQIHIRTSSIRPGSIRYGGVGYRSTTVTTLRRSGPIGSIRYGGSTILGPVGPTRFRYDNSYINRFPRGYLTLRMQGYHYHYYPRLPLGCRSVTVGPSRYYVHNKRLLHAISISRCDGLRHRATAILIERRRRADQGLGCCGCQSAASHVFRRSSGTPWLGRGPRCRAPQDGRDRGITCCCLHPGNVLVERHHTDNPADAEPMMAVEDIAQVAVLMATLPPNVEMLEAIVLPRDQLYVGRG